MRRRGFTIHGRGAVVNGRARLFPDFALMRIK
jgi:hypothetical protein